MPIYPRGLKPGLGRGGVSGLKPAVSQRQKQEGQREIRSKGKSDNKNLEARARAAAKQKQIPFADDKQERQEQRH